MDPNSGIDTATDSEQTLFNYDDFFADKPKPRSTILHDVLKKIAVVLKQHSVHKIMETNPLELLTPHNYWYKNPNSKTYVETINGQKLRLRYYYNKTQQTDSADTVNLITLYNPRNRSSVGKIHKFSKNMSLYQPSYPENFYQMWDLLRTGHFYPHCKSWLHIGSERTLGNMEAVMLSHERFQRDYANNVYHIGCFKRPLHDQARTVNGIPVTNFFINPNNCLDQTYKCVFLKNIDELETYDCISINLISLFGNIFNWDKEEHDLQGTIYYVLTTLSHLRAGGKLLIRLNLMSRSTWGILLDIVVSSFKEHCFVRPPTNPFCGDVDLLLERFDESIDLNRVYHGFLKEIYRKGMYEQAYLNIQTNRENPLHNKFNVCVDKWLETMASTIRTYGGTGEIHKTDNLRLWFSKKNLVQIDDLKIPPFLDTFTVDSLDQTLQHSFSMNLTTSSTGELTIKPVSPRILYDLSWYKKLIEMKGELNYYKRVMDNKPNTIFLQDHSATSPFITWEEFANKIDVYHKLRYILKDTYFAEHPNNGWIKMWELLCAHPTLLYQKIDSNKKTIKTFHICEAPGGFILATNQYINSKEQTDKCRVEFDWYAQTLNPKYSDSALDDHFNLMNSYPERWLFGPKYLDLGDITNSSLIKWYAEHLTLQNLDLITSDAGFPCNPQDYNEQESKLSKLNMGQIICILACLPVGKSAVCKTFLPMTEPLTLSLIYLLTNLFETVTMTKPSSSRSLNSEIYIVMDNYRGINKKLLDTLYLLLDDPKITSESLLFPKLEEKFIKRYVEIVSEFIDRQILSLNRAYYFYHNYEKIKLIETYAKICVEDWFQKHTPQPLQKPLLE